MPNFISEDQIERALVQKLRDLHGFDLLNCHTKDPEDLNDGSGRANKRDVILVDRVREAAIRLNPALPAQAIEDALETRFHLAHRRSSEPRTQDAPPTTDVSDPLDHVLATY